jgi:hypothetical protein
MSGREAGISRCREGQGREETVSTRDDERKIDQITMAVIGFQLSPSVRPSTQVQNESPTSFHSHMVHTVATDTPTDRTFACIPLLYSAFLLEDHEISHLLPVNMQVKLLQNSLPKLIPARPIILQLVCMKLVSNITDEV